MSELKVSIARRLLWIGTVGSGLLIAAAVMMALIRMTGALLRAEPLASSALLRSPIDQDDLANGFIVLAFLAIELARNGWRGSALRRILLQSDASTRTDLCYFVLSTTGVMAIIGTIATLGLGNALNLVVDAGIGLHVFTELPPYAAVPAVFLIESFAQYWCHRAMHTPLLWRLHAVHHAADDFNVVISIRHHPGTFVFYWIIVLSPALLGFSGEAMAIAMVVSNVHSTYVHTDMPTSTFLERWVFFGPHGHGIHHGANPGCLNMNFGDLVIWDRLFGTYKTDIPEPLVYGCEDPEGVYQSGRPLRDMVAVQISWARLLWHTVASRLAPIARPV